MLGLLGQVTETGWYNAAFKVIGVSTIPASLIGLSFFPALSSALSDPQKLQRIWNYQMKAMIFLVVPIVVGGITLAPRIISFIYGADFSPSILAFQILLVSVGLMILYSPLAQALLIFNQQKKTLWIAPVGAGVNVLLNLILIPTYSLYGAAISTVFTYAVIFFLVFLYAVKLTPIKILNYSFVLAFVGALTSSFAMYLFISQPPISSVPVYAVVCFGAIIYCICYLGYERVIRKLRFTPSSTS